MYKPLCVGALLIAPAALSAQTVDYHKADLIRVAGAYVLGAEVRPTWMSDSIRFYYKSSGSKDANTFYLVDPVGKTKRVFFDHNRMASAISIAADTVLDPTRFPNFKIVNKDATLEASVHKNVIQCDLATYHCVQADSNVVKRRDRAISGPEWAVRSPDKKWDAFLWRQNIYVRPAEKSDAELVTQIDSISRELAKRKADSIANKGAKPEPKKAEPDSVALPSGSIQLTTDGEEKFSYGNEPRDVSREKPKIKPTRVQLKWSPDSKRIVVLKNDARKVRIYPMYSSTKDQPEDKSYVYAAPGDTALVRYEIHVLDIIACTNVTVKDEPNPNIVHGMTGLSSVKWGRGSDKIYALNSTRGSHRVRANMIDATTGAIRTQIARDSNATFVELDPGGRAANWEVVNNGEDIIWYSERDGWSHLYRFDEKGTLKNQIESGAYAVMGMPRVDSVKKQVYFTANGKEPGVPYYTRLYRVNFDGSGMTLLTPEEGVHSVSFTPKGEFFIDTYSKRDAAPVIMLRSAVDGRSILELSRGDAELLKGIGWTPAEVFQVKARDGVTDLWGVMYKPSTFDPRKSYPIVTHIYPGPQTGSVGTWGFDFRGSEPRAFAELGFIVIELDHQGTPGRSKAFHDFYYGNMGDNGIPDHIAAIKQLAAKYPWIDINRVGIYGHSGGGLASTDAILRWPDFFKVAVSGAGNHNPATYGFFWAEKYQGLYNKKSYEEAANYTLAKNLKGHLLLMHGDMDNNVHMANTLKVVDALIKANKTFDMLIVPDASHGLPDYTIRRRWDYFVTYLLGKTPPADYEMMSAR